MALNGKATQRLLTVDPGSVDFGRVEVSSPVESKEITVVNKSSTEQWVVVKLRDLEGTNYALDTKALDSKPIPAQGSATIDFPCAGPPGDTVRHTYQLRTVGGSEVQSRTLTGSALVYEIAEL